MQKSIIIVGPDGSGKNAIATALMAIDQKFQKTFREYHDLGKEIESEKISVNILEVKTVGAFKRIATTLPAPGKNIIPIFITQPETFKKLKDDLKKHDYDDPIVVKLMPTLITSTTFVRSRLPGIHAGEIRKTHIDQTARMKNIHSDCIFKLDDLKHEPEITRTVEKIAGDIVKKVNYPMNAHPVAALW